MPHRTPIRAYHDLLRGAVADDSAEHLETRLRERGLAFGTRPLCSVLRPRFLTPDQYRYLRARVAILLRAFAKAHRAALEDPRLLEQFGLADWERELLRRDPGFPVGSPVSRLDAFYVPEDGGLRFTEYNAETPAGGSYSDELADIFLTMPVLREFARAWDVRPLPVRHNILHALVGAFEAWRGVHERPRVAILDWKEVPTYSEFVVTQQYFREHGLACVIADPREVEYRGGKLWAGDTHVTLIYKRVLISELVDRGGLDHPVVRAVQDGAVCLVNPFRCKILHKKASLAVLGDERNADLFSAEELRAIEDHIPWTRRVAERWTSFHGERVDLLPFIQEARERLVLKPNDEYGGAGVVLGWETGPAEWEAAVQRALAEPYVVQERIPIPSEAYPSVVDGRLVLGDRIMDTAPFAFGGAFTDGVLTRLSTESLVNVTAGGGSTVPTFVVEPR